MPLTIETLSTDLALQIYRVTERFPIREHFGLAREMRRSAVSVGSNIAEGRGRRSDTEFNRYLDIAIGSLRELEYQGSLAVSLGYVDEGDAATISQLCARLAAGLLGLQRHLQTR